MKKILIAIMIMAVFSLTACGGSSAKAEARDALKQSIDLTWLTSDVRNDSTGKWRVAECLTDQQPSEYAKQYYAGYFESDDEIHAVINFTLNTTNRITVSGDQIIIDVLNYVDGEEHDANLLFSGELLETQTVNK